jgi:hypothetical protein
MLGAAYTFPFILPPHRLKTCTKGTISPSDSLQNQWLLGPLTRAIPAALF